MAAAQLNRLWVLLPSLGAVAASSIPLAGDASRIVLEASVPPGVSPVRATLSSLTVARRRLRGPCSVHELGSIVADARTAAQGAACAVCEPGTSEALLIVDPADVRSIRTPLKRLLARDVVRRSRNETALALKGRCRAAPPPADLALLVPTYPGHVAYYVALVRSLSCLPRATSAPWDLVSVLGSVPDLVAVARAAHGRGTPAARFLIFDGAPPIQPDMRAPGFNKYTYQSCKKLWAWHHVRHEYVLVLDSDFRLLRPVNLHALAPHLAWTVHATDVANRFGLDRKVLAFTNMLLPPRLQLKTLFPFEMPWVIARPVADRLHARLRHQLRAEQLGEMARGGGGPSAGGGAAYDYIQALLDMDRPLNFFEIILYRAVLLGDFGANVTLLPLSAQQQKRPFGTAGYMFERRLDNRARAQLYAAAPALLAADGGAGYGVSTADVVCQEARRRKISRASDRQNGKPWLLVHADRADILGTCSEGEAPMPFCASNDKPI